MLEFFDPTTGAVTAAVAIGIRLLEAVWKEVRKRSRRAYKLKRAQQASDAQTLLAGVEGDVDVTFEGEDRRYDITQTKPRTR